MFTNNKLYKRWIEIGFSLILFWFIFSFFSICLFVLIALLKYYSQKKLQLANILVIQIISVTIIYHLYINIPDLGLIIFNKNRLFFSVRFRRNLLDNRKNEQRTLQEYLWQFIFFPVFFIPFYYDSASKKSNFNGFFKMLLVFLSVYIFTKALFSESFYYWKFIWVKLGLLAH